MAITSFTIEGVEVDPLTDKFEIRETEGGVSTIVCEVVSTGSPVQRFSVFDDIEVYEDGTLIFAGIVSQTRERGFGGEPNIFDPVTDTPEIVTSITAEDFTRLAERVFVTMSVADGTDLDTFLASLVTDHLSDLGVTLHASQSTVVTLPAFEFARERASDVLQKVCEPAGLLWRIDYQKQLRVWVPGDLTAPFNIDEADDPARWTGDVEVENILGDEYANSVTVVVGPIEVLNRVESFTGDGVTTVFTLTAQLTAHRGYVTDNTGTDPVTNDTLTTTEFDGSAAWTYHPSTNTLERKTGALPNGQVASITFDGFLYLTGTAEDAAEIADKGLYEHQEQRDDLTTQADVDAVAADILAQRLQAGDQIATYESRYVAPTLRAGQQQTLTAPLRGLSGGYIVTDMSVRAEYGLGLIRRVTTKKHKLGKWQDTYRDWLLGKGGGALSISTGGGATGSTGPAPPDESVQTHQGGVFAGKSTFVFKYAENSLVCGGGGSSITAANHESCQVFGYNCHITDAGSP